MQSWVLPESTWGWYTGPSGLTDLAEGYDPISLAQNGLSGITEPH